ncbi:DHA2 family efflux MFS transporter permease subunit [Paenibacillus albiflavus]|uniref:DHA2 family efflux MFS transporter permease subunit n=1 Tax=Paenibacillus albiflavus TaxID=2545760 RepID=A0A4R4EM90_9BACL|nr:MDR family MFS transporter [Paenibacillus albiflavus]TCZ80927.1 DHA2 family efflux MFS transporter permease subunit [Paenibacillus albiflavus]
MYTNRRNITLALLVATFLAAIEVTVVSTAMPTIVGELGGLELISWVFAIYLLTSAITTPIFGKLADLYGRKKIFIAGSVLFLIGSMLCGLAGSMTSLIWFRALQGIGAGALLPVTFTIIGDVYPYEKRGQMQGIFSSIWGIAALVGPLVGGFFVDSLSWRWIFYFNLPFGIVSIALIWMFLKESVNETNKKIDYAGAITFSIAMTAFLFAVISGGGEYAWTSPLILGLFGIFIVFSIAFYIIELRAEDPMIPLKLFKIRDITVSNASGFFISAVSIALSTYLPMWVQGVMGKGATFAGLTLSPMSIGWLIGSVVSGKLLVKHGTKIFALMGCGFITIACFILLLADTDTSYWYFIGLMFIGGIGFGLSMTVFTVIVQSSVGWEIRGASTGLATFTRTLGQTIGIAIFGTWMNKEIASLSASNSGRTFDFNEINKLLDPKEAVLLPSDQLSQMHNILASSLHSVFIFICGAAIAGLLAVLWMPRHENQLDSVKREEVR